MNLEYSKIGSRSANIRWLEPYTRNQNTSVQHYWITVQNKESNTTEDPIQIQEKFYHLTSLHPNYHYTITVEAVTLNTNGPNATIDIQTHEDSKRNGL